MSHFAELDQNNIVLRVIVADTREWCEQNHGGRWMQTSYTGSMRKNYAGIGYTYDALRDAFIPPKPSDTAVLDETTCRWVEPVPQGANVPVV